MRWAQSCYKKVKKLVSSDLHNEENLPENEDPGAGHSHDVVNKILLGTVVLFARVEDEIWVVHVVFSPHRTVGGTSD